MEHKTEIEKYGKSLKDLAEDIGDLRYDALSEFLDYLSQKIKSDGEKDNSRNRTKLSNRLFACSEELAKSKKEIDSAWEICKKYL